jgi:hypothetical protein
MLNDIRDRLTYLLRINRVTRETRQRSFNIKSRPNKSL